MGVNAGRNCNAQPRELPLNTPESQMNGRETNVASLGPDEKRALLEKLLRERKERRFPLSSAQKRLWFLDKLQPNSAVYNVPTVLALRGELELEA